MGLERRQCEDSARRLLLASPEEFSAEPNCAGSPISDSCLQNWENISAQSVDSVAAWVTEAQGHVHFTDGDTEAQRSYTILTDTQTSSGRASGKTWKLGVFKSANGWWEVSEVPLRGVLGRGKQGAGGEGGAWESLRGNGESPGGSWGLCEDKKVV